MKITKAESQLIRLLVETSNLQGEEADDAWGLLERIQQHEWSDEMDDEMFWPDEDDQPTPEEENICPLCDGSGEGDFEGSRCPRCKGKGEV